MNICEAYGEYESLCSPVELLIKEQRDQQVRICQDLIKENNDLKKSLKKALDQIKKLTK